MFRGTMCPSSGEITVYMRHLALVTLYWWLSGTQGPPCIPDSLPYSVKIANCRIDTVISPDDGHIVARNAEKRNKHTKKNCAPSWLYLQDYTGTHGQQNVTKHKEIRSLFTPIAVRTQQALNKLSKLYIHDTNKCTFYVYKYNVISLLHVSTSRHPRRTETCSRYIRLYLYIYKRCICWCHEWTF